MEAHRYDKWGPLAQFSFDFEENSTTLFSLIDPRMRRGYRTLKKGDKILFRKIVIEGVYEGMLFKGHMILHENGYINVSLVKRAKIIEKEDTVKLDFDNALDRVLMEMEALDMFGNEALDD